MSRFYGVDIDLDDNTTWIYFSLPGQGRAPRGGHVTIPSGDIPKFLAQAIAALDIAGHSRIVEGLGYKNTPYRGGREQGYGVYLHGARASATTRALMRVRERQSE